MQSALSHNELEILDRQVAAISYQLSEIAGSLESRLGPANELARSAREAHLDFTKFAHRVRRRVALADSSLSDSSPQTA
jgi:hypothetical protein